MNDSSNISFDNLLACIRALPEQQRQELIWSLRKEEAVEDHNRLDREIFEGQQ